jgi:hypothetical protein
VNWEVFLPARFKVADFGGNAIPAALVASAGPDVAAGEGATEFTRLDQFATLQQAPPVFGVVGGLVVDPSGGVVQGVRVVVVQVATGFTRTTDTDSSGRWSVAGFSSGKVRATADANGFKRQVQEFDYNAARPRQVIVVLQVGSVTESVTVTGSTVASLPLNGRNGADLEMKASAPPPAPAGPSSAVLDLKQRVAGVLPIAIDVPRTDTSYRFVKPLVIDEETTVTFAYRTK